MIYINPISVVNAAVLSNIILILFIVLSKKKSILANTSLKIFGLIVALFFVRVFLPIEFGFAKEIGSYSIIPYILEVLNTDLNLGFLSGSVTVLEALAVIWITGVVILALKHIYTYCFLLRSISALPDTEDLKFLNILKKIKAENNYNFSVKLIINKAIPSVMEFGYFSQTVLLPECDYSQEEAEYILKHELNHFANKSNWIKLGIMVISTVLWWNPLSALFLRSCDELLEIYCDYGVIKGLPVNDRVDYLNCLLTSIKKDLNRGRAYGFISCLSRSRKHKSLKTRFKLVLEHKRNKRAETAVALLAAITFISTYTIIFQPAYEPYDVDLEWCINDLKESNSYIKYEEGMYIVYYYNEVFIEVDSMELLDKLGVDRRLLRS